MTIAELTIENNREFPPVVEIPGVSVVTNTFEIRERNRQRRWAEQIEAENASYRDIKFAELAFLRSRLPKGFVTKYCLFGPRGDHDDIALKYSDKGEKAHYDGAHKCGSVWVCPVCVEKITAERRNELKLLLATTKYRIVMVTFTIHHERGDELKAQVDNLNKAVRAMKSHRAWRKFKARWGLVGHVQALEVTHGGNGWHTHRHEMFVLDPIRFPALNDENRDRVALEMQAELFAMYQHELEKQGLTCDAEHGVKVSANRKEYGAYVAKWGVSEELTRQATKQANGGGKSVWQLLKEAATGNEYSWSLFLEYCYAFKGKKQLHWSKGLRDLLTLPQETADQAIAEDESDRVNDRIIATFSRQGWHYLVEKDLLGPVLNYCERVKGDTQQVMDFLARMGLRRYVAPGPIPLGIIVDLHPPNISEGGPGT